MNPSHPVGPRATSGTATSGWRSARRSHVGRVRSVNEDRILADDVRALWGIADGMGGHGGGDIAAQLAVDTLAASEPREALETVFGRANRAIHAHAGGRSGTTLVACQLAEGTAHLYWVGDSRAYLLRAGTLRQITRDHSVVEDLVAAGLIEPWRAHLHPQAHVLTRALGTEPEIAVDTATLALQEGDRLLLCSDGLSRTLEPGDCSGEAPLAALADRLVANALARDGSDNISLVLIEPTAPR